MVKEYTQVVQPVSRVPEKIFGWLGWIALLALTGYILFLSLFKARDQAFLDQMRTNLHNELGNQGVAPGDAASVVNTLEAGLQNSWLLALLLLIPLILAFIGLTKMNKRILAGMLLLISAIIIAPLVFTLFSSLMFVIAAILLFARKDKVITEGAAGEYINRRPDYARDNHDRHDRTITRDRDDLDRDNRRYDDRNDRMAYEADERNQEELDRLERERRNDNSKVHFNDHTRDNDYDDLEKTKQFTVVDENIDSQEIDYPVTEEEYDRQEGYVVDEDAARQRRENVNRRNNDSL